MGGVVDAIGGGLSEMNPFHKIDTTPAPTLQGPSTVSAGPGAKIGAVNGANAQQATGVGVGSQNDFRNAQLAQINGLQDMATGKDNSAQQMLQMQTQQNVANQFAMANSARPGGQAMAMRNSMNNAAQMNAQANVQGAQLGMQQRLQAAGLAGNIAGQGAGQDISVAGQNAQLGTQTSIANMQGNSQRAVAQGQMDTTANAQNIQAQEANQGAGLKYNDQQQNQWAQVNGMNSKNEQARRQGIGQLVGGIAGAAVGMPGLGSAVGGMFSGGSGATDSGDENSTGGQPGPDDLGSGMDLGLAHGGIVPTPQGIHIPYSLLLKRIVGGK